MTKRPHRYVVARTKLSQVFEVIDGRLSKAKSLIK